MQLEFNGVKIEYITDDKGLANCIDAISNLDEIAIDIEFDRERYTYGFTMCLIQIGIPGRCFLIDTIEFKNVKPLYRVFENPAICKIIHNGGEDVKLLNYNGCYPQNIFDSHIAALMLNYEKIGLEAIISAKLQVSLNKSSQGSNWVKRPLTIKQLEYATDDVVYLSALRKILTAELNSEGKYEWFLQEMSRIAALRQEEDKRVNYLSKSDEYKYPPDKQHILNELYKLRDLLAQKYDKPPFQIMPPEVLHEIADNPAIINKLDSLEKGLHPAFKKDNWTKNQFAETYKAAVEYADANNLPKVNQPLTNEQKWNMRREREKREAEFNALFLPLCQAINDTYGLVFGRHILSRKGAENLFNQKQTLTDLVPYKKEVIEQTAAKLGLDVSAYN